MSALRRIQVLAAHKYERTPKERPILEMLMVSIDISEVRFE